MKSTLINNIFRKIGISFDNKHMNEHVLSQNTLDNHRTQLCKCIIEFYLNTRLFYEASKILKIPID